MAFIPAAFAAIGSAITAVSAAASSVIGAAIVGAKLIGIPAALAAAAVPAIVQGIAVGALTMGLNALTTPKIHSSGSPVAFKGDTDAGIPYLMGRFGVGGNIVAAMTSYGDKNKFLHYVVALSGAGPIHSIESFSANDIAVSFNGSGAVTSGHYSGRMWQKQQLGASTDTYLSAPSGSGTVPEWDSTHKMTGYAAARWALQFDQEVYPTGTPKPLWVCKGVKVYDPRLDSTYDGGSGSHRIDDETTWEWSDNPWLHALAFIIGRHQNSKRVMGLGADPSAIDLDAFVEAANVAEDNEWTCGGQVSSKDDKWQVLQALAQAGGGSIVRQGAYISCIVNTPRVSVDTITGADIVGPVTIPGTQSRRTRINSILYRYPSEDHGWEMVSAEKVSISSYVTADGGTRTRSVDMPLVTDVNQGAQLSYYAIVDSRELGPVTLPLKPQYSGLKAGDLITVTDPELELSAQEMLVLSRSRDPRTGAVTLTCRTETSAKHAAALALSGTAPPTPTLTGVDLTTIAAPSATYWAATTATVTSSGGVSFPAIVVAGDSAADNPSATELVMELKQSSAASWSALGTFPLPATTRKEILDVIPGTNYDVRLAYKVKGITGAWLTLSTVTAGTFAASGGSSDVTPAAVNWGNISVSGASPITGANAAQTISGISAPISLDVSWTGTGTGEYQKNSGSWTALSSGDNIVMSNGDTLAFRFTRTGSAGTSSGTVTVTNDTDSATVLDTFTYSCEVLSDDVTPTPTPDWSNAYASGVSGVGYTDTQTIDGITTSITLRFDIVENEFLTGSENGTNYQLAYKKNSGSYTDFTTGQTLSMADNDTLHFRITGLVAGFWGSVVTVVNETDGNATLDTFAAQSSWIEI